MSIEAPESAEPERREKPLREPINVQSRNGGRVVDDSRASRSQRDHAVVVAHDGRASASSKPDRAISLRYTDSVKSMQRC